MATVEQINLKLYDLQASTDFNPTYGISAKDAGSGSVRLSNKFVSGSISADAALQALGNCQPVNLAANSDEISDAYEPIWSALKQAGLSGLSGASDE